jgi:hypothetical protein
MGRKYRQPGYQSDEQPVRERRPQQKVRKTSDGPRSPRMPGFQELMRCAMCGNIIPMSLEITGESQCPKCNADLRSCKHCRHFDTSARLECTQPIVTRIMAKDLRNDCEYFLPRTSVERETSSPSNGSMPGPAPRTPKDARSAFDDLFR